MPGPSANSSSKDFMGPHVRQAAAMLLVFGTSYFAVWTSPGGDGVSCGGNTVPRGKNSWRKRFR